MAKYIDLEAALREIKRRERLMVGDKTIPVDALKRFLLNRPAADVAPVTRCKDCANSYEDAFGRVCAYGICVDCTVPDDFYCASSKPKEATC